MTDGRIYRGRESLGEVHVSYALVLDLVLVSGHVLDLVLVLVLGLASVPHSHQAAVRHAWGLFS